MTLEQHSFELLGSSYMPIFKTNTTVLHYHQLFESADVERYIWRDSQKLQAAVQLSTVTLFYAVTHP